MRAAARASRRPSRMRPCACAAVPWSHWGLLSLAAAGVIHPGCSSSRGAVLDLADPFMSLRYWLPHPVLGEASFDAFEQSDANPVYEGSAPWLWPVNGFLAGGLRNKPAIMYVGLYQQGYKAGHTVCNYTSQGAMAAAGCAPVMLQLQSDDHGISWNPWPAADPLACNGDPASFDKGTGCPDGSTAAAQKGADRHIRRRGSVGGRR